MFNKGIFISFLLLLTLGVRAEDGRITSSVYAWDDLEVKQISKGERRSIMRVPTSILAEFEIHTTMLNEGMKSHDQHTHVEDETIIIRYGQVEELIDDKPYKAGPGSVISLASNGHHGIRNIGEGPCEYYAFKWRLP